MGGLSRHVLRQIFFLSGTVIVPEHKKPRSSPILGGLLSLVSSTTSLKRYLKRAQVDKGRAVRFIQGTPCSRRTDRQAPRPAGQPAVLPPGRFSVLFGAFFSLGKNFCQSIQKKSPCVHFPFCSIYISREDSGSCVGLLMSICNLFAFIFVLAFYLLLFLEMREVYWKKNKDFY